MSAEQRKKIIILMINMFIAIGSFGIIIPILPAYLASINQGGTAAGLMIAIFAGAQLIFSPIAGKWTDQFGRRKMIIYGLVGLTLSMFIFYAVNSIWLLYASRIIGGIGAALLIPAIFAYVADITTFDQRAKGNSLVSAAMSLGIVVGPGIGGFLADFGLKFPFLISALVSLSAVVFSIFVLKESETAQVTQSMDAKTETMLRKIALSVKKPYFIPLIITLVMSFGLMAYESVIGLYLDNQFNSTPKDIAVMVTATGIVSVIVQLFVVDRIVQRFGEVNVLNIFISVAAIGFLLSLFASNYLIFFLISLIIFLSTSILRPVLNTLISKMAGNEQGFAMGMNNAYMSIGNVLGPTLAGMMYDVHITYPFMLGLILLFITLMITMAWQKRSLHAKALS
ncbi:MULTISPECIES: MFS transporter [Bacillaceae]|uniref:Tetracycline resistance MFS efflux pump n=1 Tax=Peribacillus frigoritolerans TaxID=450367 RepID=A0AAJ1QMW5_9BACI|nr:MULTISPECIES: tetracycline resistance MFS efflux pump [Bacillaceae]MCD1160975.1 tetracycline resistance MFS efflux pump [Peribacillus castrilensis]MCP1094317.1 tetracycline resistance MFS efflux pump [Bacillaceae bacterium OS4b]QYF80881.1 tetracycline resistance MFS efflux pump [Brevibacterium sp. PAMC21349]MBD8590110.1 tetracycline resistance MFS efflux pump [Peribacillus simplex]MCF7622403.1 tetracycline resistance MFS efflux pump [Peribacillus frigoritolerans]